MRKYSLTVLMLVAILLGASVAVSAFAYRNTLFKFSFAELYRYQLAKLANPGKPEAIFIGDSSLGNAIDVARWETLSGAPAMSLALTGAYGYAGSLNMLKRVETLPSVRTVVIFQTPDMAARDDAHSGYVHSYDGWLPLGDIPLRALAAAYLNIDTVREALKGAIRGPAPSQGRIADDYVRQGLQLSPEKIEKAKQWSLPADAMRPDNLFYLRSIGEWCKVHDYRCIYVHGPLLEPMCRNIPDYLDQLNREIRAAGLLLATEGIPCLSAEEVGDAEDHVLPRLKGLYTERYYRAIDAVLLRDPHA